MTVLSLIEKVRGFLERERLLYPDTPVVVGVSGGADSVALLHLLRRLGYPCVVCHCNFNLRGPESVRDRDFVCRLAEEWSVPFEESSFDTARYAEENHLSVEMACRKLRYDWFESVRLRYGAQAIAVAHHRDDNVETFFLNLLRGTSIAGLTAMKPRNGFVVRPLLAVTREEIEQYLSEQNIAYVTDSTNREPIYTRNKIRLQLLPLLRSINPSVERSVETAIAHLREVEAVYRSAIESQRSRVMAYRGEHVYISIAELMALPSPKSFLFETLSPLGFVSEQIEAAISACDGVSGKYFLSPTHRLLKDRECLILSPLGAESGGDDIVASIETLQSAGSLLQERLTYRCVENHSGYLPRREADSASLDLEKLDFPLTIRHWRQGDRFIPFGMKGYRKLSDYFSDKKYSLADKNEALLLCSGEKIVWILGERVAEGYRITPDTRHIIEFKYKK